MREGPEEEEGECEREGKDEGEAVGGEVVRWIRTLTARRVVDEVRDVLDILLVCSLWSEEGWPEGQTYDLGIGKILKISAPAPNPYGIVSRVELEVAGSTRGNIRRIAYQEQQVTPRDMVEGVCD